MDKNWKPEFGVIYTWFAVDKHGKTALFLNNCFGGIPKILLEKNNIENLLDRISDFTWEDLAEDLNYPDNKNGNMYLDYYSGWRYPENAKDELFTYLMSDYLDRKNFSDANIAINKGMFFYQAVEGGFEGEDYPVGYLNETKMGDYYRYLVPTVFGDIHDFPKELWSAIAVSDTLDFTVDRVLDNNKINDYFTYCADEVKEFDQ